jgi:DNA-binding SARP family transcriptional activator
MEWVDPANGQTLPAADPTTGSRDRAAAISLLALLLCQPNRQAHRDWIMEQFWPDGKRDVAIHRLENIFSCLRRLLRPPSGGESLVRSTIGKKTSGTSYCLEPYPKLWVDTDALTCNIEQACRMERFGDDALPYWQRAFDLLKRGPFLVDDPYEPYAAWVQKRREVLGGYYRQCVHALARLYLARQGEAGKAEALLLLRTYWQQAKTDEDALRPLLELLGEQERYQEAEEYYQQLLVALAELGPDEDGQPRTPDQRTRDIHEYLRTKQIRREPIKLSDLPMSTSKAVSLERQTLENLPDTVYSVPLIPDTPSQLADSIMSRREASKKIVTMGTSLFTIPMLGLMQIGSMLHDEEILAICTTSLPIFWRLFFDGAISEVQRVLPSYISQLALLVRQSPEYQQQAASLSSKAHQLACMGALQLQDYGSALIHVDQALRDASIADDMNLRVASLIRKGLAYRYINRYYKKCPHQVLAAYQEAVQYSSFVSPLLRGRLSTGLAEAYSELEQEDEAKRALERAYTIFPKKPQDDPNFSYTHFKLPKGFEVVMYLNLGKAREAWEILETIDASVPMAVVPDRVELAIDQARAAFLLGNMTQSCHYVEFAATSAITLGSHLRYHEAHSIYEQMKIQWPCEQRVKALAEYFNA